MALTHQDALPAGTQQRLVDFAELVATAIANAHAREELRTLADQQAALRRVATLVARTPPPEAVFAAVAEEVGRLLEADLTVLARYEADDTATVVGLWSRLGDAVAVGSRVPLGGHNTTTLVFKTGRPARIDHHAAEDASAVTAIARSVGVRSAVAAPITVEGRLWGLVTAASTGQEPSPPATKQRLAAFTELVATAIANTQVREELTASRARASPPPPTRLGARSSVTSRRCPAAPGLPGAAAACGAGGGTARGGRAGSGAGRHRRRAG